MDQDVEQFIDPRVSIIDKRLSSVKRIVVFASGKGGVGKSSLSTVSSLLLAKQGYRTGLLDFDFHGASDHLFLGADLSFPEESYGILPHKLAFGLRFMSIAFFTGEHGVPLRGPDITNAILELLTVTIWDKLDFLIVDMPPGIGDEVLDLIRFMNRSEIVIVTSPSVVSVKVVKRLLDVFLHLKMPMLGIVENLRRPEAVSLNLSEIELARERRIPFLGSIPAIADFEEAIGNPELLVSGGFGLEAARILAQLT